jgi:serine phosphatase RsbU (regulator of sigma subunit)
MKTSSPPGSAVFEADFHLQGARDLARSVRHFLERHRLGDQAASEWELVAAEAAKCAVEKGLCSRQRQDNLLRALVHVWPESVELCVDYPAPSFSLSSPGQSANELDESNLGHFIITQLTDCTRHLSGTSSCTLVMRRFRPSANGGCSDDSQCGECLENTLHVMTADLGATYESLCCMFQFSKELGECDDMEHLIKKWLPELLRITGSTWFIMRRHQPESNSLQLLASSIDKNDGSSGLASLSLDAEAAQSVETCSAKTLREVWFDGCSSPSLLDHLTEYFDHPVSGISCPVHVAGHLFGVLTLGGSSSTCLFNTRDTRVIRMFADYIALRLRHEQALHEVTHSRLLHRDLSIAAEMMRSLLPRQLPELPGYTCDASLQPAQSVSGDLYDFLSLPDKGTLFVIADVMGKGPAAALFAIMFRTHLHTLAHLASTPGELLTSLNDQLFQDLSHSDMFVSAQLAWFENSSGSITIASAGHCPALIIDEHGRQLVEAWGDGPPLGIDQHATFSEVKIEQHQACHMLMFTDGATDAQNQNGEMLGKDSLVSCLVKFAGQGGNASRLKDSVLSLISQHVQNAPAVDDITLVTISRDRTP